MVHRICYCVVPEGWGVLIKNFFCGGGMDILWNYTLQTVLHTCNSLKVFILVPKEHEKT